MKISTSINISISRRERLIAAALKLDVPVREVLFALMVKSRIYYDQIHAALWRTVEYQPESIIEGEPYVIMHVELDPLGYEFGVSERLLFKVSVSLIYRVAIDLFLDDLVSNGLHETVCDFIVSTNHRLLKYDVTYRDSSVYEFWTIKWEKRTKDKEKTKIISRRIKRGKS